MKLKLVLAAIFALITQGRAYATDPNVNLTAVSQCTGAVLGVQCPANPVGPLNPLWIQFQLSGGATPSTAQKQDTGNNILNSMLGLTPQLSVDGGALSHITNFPAVTLPPNAAQETGGNLALTSTNTGSTATNTGLLVTASALQATATKQDIGNTSLATITTNTSTTATNTGAISTATGTTADAAYSGSGTSTIVAALKGLYAKLAGTLTISGSVTTTPASGTVAAPYVLTALGQQVITSATLATAQSLTVPATATIADIYPEGTAGTNNQCVRYRDDGTAPTAASGSGLAPQQNLLGYSAKVSAGTTLANIQFILATGAICTLTINYYK